MKINEILEDLYDRTAISQQMYDENIKHAKQQLLELLESCKPEDLEVPDGGEYTREAWAVYDRAVAHNEATKQYQSNIRKLFEVEG